MTPEEIAEIKDDLDEVFTEMAGDTVIFVDEDGVQTSLACMVEDLEKSDGEGLEIGGSGMKPGKMKKVWILTKELETKGVALDVTGHFLIAGERWDFAEDWPLRDSIVPLAGIQNLIEVVIRCSVEIAQSAQGGEIGFAGY